MITFLYLLFLFLLAAEASGQGGILSLGLDTPTSEQQKTLGHQSEPISPARDPEKPLPDPSSFFPGHPKQRGNEAACIRIPESEGIHGPCDSHPIEPDARRAAGPIAISRDGSLLAVAAKGASRLYIYDTKTLRQRQNFETAPLSVIQRLFFGSQSKLVVYSSEDRMTLDYGVRVFDLDKELEMQPHKFMVRDKAFEAYKRILEEHMPSVNEVVSSETQKLWMTNLVLATRACEDEARGLFFPGSRQYGSQAFQCGEPLSEDGRYLLVTPGTDGQQKRETYIVDIESPEQTRILPFGRMGLGKDMVVHFRNSSLPGRSFIAALTQEGDQFKISDVVSRETVDIPLPDGGITGLLGLNELCKTVFSPDGKAAVVRTSKHHAIWRIEDGTLLPLTPELPHHTGPFSFSADAKLLVVAAGADIRLYDTSSGNLYREWSIRNLVDRVTRHTLASAEVYRRSHVVGLKHTDDGLVVCTLVDGSVALFDLETKREGWITSPTDYDPKKDSWLFDLDYAPFGKDVQVVLSPDGKTLYSADLDGNVRVWSLNRDSENVK
ncbi:peptidase c14 [Moniliophthora roreri MCA 2997]|uniref:Peptidase c14 n=1 Tax=Moniliophthora roreri (strain MCA 2997) TaxID=1381753 RepID=V2X9K3_MONRO|nr:peptidase c14 [Moniliophthora roreri MCA 2997]